MDPTAAQPRADRVATEHRLRLAGRHEIDFSPGDVVLHRRKTLPFHPHGMSVRATDAAGTALPRRPGGQRRGVLRDLLTSWRPMPSAGLLPGSD